MWIHAAAASKSNPATTAPSPRAQKKWVLRFPQHRRRIELRDRKIPHPAYTSTSQIAVLVLWAGWSGRKRHGWKWTMILLRGSSLRLWIWFRKRRCIRLRRRHLWSRYQCNSSPTTTSNRRRS
jgi:hypothetical protein